MGVVRREGDWRLRKLEEGLYEITYRKQPRERIATHDYSDRTFRGAQDFGLSLSRVDSYSEVEGLFEELAHGPASHSLSSQSSGTQIDNSRSGDPLASDLDGFDDLEDVPPGMAAIVLIIAGGLILWSVGPSIGSPAFLLGLATLLAGLAIIGIVVALSDDLPSAISRLANAENKESNPQKNNEQVEKTPPTPEKLKNDLFFDRANQKCEWCGEPVDQPEVHHIVPRSEGGPNQPSNLIVLCPNHHRKADAGAISQTKLKAKVRRLSD